jgi:hypothetical protein
LDTFNFLIAVVLIILAASYGATWLVIGIVVIMALTMRSLSSSILLVITVAVIYFLRGDISNYAPFILFGLVVLALALGAIEKPQQQGGGLPPELFGMGGYGGMGGEGG